LSRRVIVSSASASTCGEEPSLPAYWRIVGICVATLSFAARQAATLG
jgi:hypothetical protein